MTIQTITIRDFFALAPAYLATDVPLLLLGPPGGGKTSVVRQLAQRTRYRLQIKVAPELYTSDLLGVPFPDHQTKSTVWYRPDFLPTEERTILFLDELASADKPVLKALTTLMLEARVGGHTLPPHCPRIAASNRVEDQSGAQNLPAHLANRIAWFELTTDVDQWIDWALGETIDADVIGFIKWRGIAALHAFTSGLKGPFPSPRAWERVSWLLREGALENWSLERITQAVNSLIGPGMGSEFAAFEKLRHELPSTDDILAGKPVAKPQKPDVIYAIAMSLAARMQTKNARRAADWMKGSLPREVTVLALKIAAKREPAIVAEVKHLTPDLLDLFAA